MKFFWFPLFLILLASCTKKPMDIYMSPQGKDAQTGTSDLPVKTFERALEIAGDSYGKRSIRIILQDGTYYLPKTIEFTGSVSGSQKYPLIIKAANEGKAHLSGGSKPKLQWEPFKKGIMRAVLDVGTSIDQLYVNGQRQRMARFPNARKGYNVFDCWELIHTRNPDPEKDPLDPERIAGWKNPEGAYLHAMHPALWGDMHWLVKGKMDDGTLDIEGGWQNNRPGKMHERYRFIENVFEELDSPGEWYYDVKARMIYYYPYPDMNLTKANIEIVWLKHLIEFNGTRNKRLTFIELNGLVFKHTARSFMDNKEPLLRSDWTIYRGGAVVFNNSEDCLIKNCEFDQTGGNSIFVNNYNRRIKIIGCYIHHSGANGIAFTGDPSSVRSPLFRYCKQNYEEIDLSPGPEGDNYPSDCLVRDCLITMTGRDEKQTAPVQISMSHKIRISHCSVYDVPRAGINISEGTFGGHIIEYCDVFNTVLETGDHGSFNSWGRDRYWTPDIKKTAMETQKNPSLIKLDMLDSNIIRNNRWRCDHGWDVDLDDGSSWYRIYNNVLLNGGLKLREGYDRVVTNNIIINNSLHPHVWYPCSGDVFKNNIVYGAYRPAIMNRGIEEDGKWGKELDHNLFVCSREEKEKFSVNGCDLHSLIGDPLFMNPEIGNYWVRDSSPALIIGFKNFPTDTFGVVSEKLKTIAKTPEIPRMLIQTKKYTGSIQLWMGAKIKNIETLGEQSANGLSSIRGVILLTVPVQSKAALAGFRTSDVILGCQEREVGNFSQLQDIFNPQSDTEIVKFEIMRNQEKQFISFKLPHKY